MIKDKKDKVIVIRISEMEYEKFKKLCEKKDITASFCLREYIRSCILKFSSWLFLDD